MPNARAWEVPAARAECHECGWKGALRETVYDADPDADRHICPAACDSGCGPVGHVTGCAARKGVPRA